MGQGRNLKTMMQLLFSISVVSFLISISSWVCYGFQTVRFCVTTLPVQLITHSINRNCIFLICNGLLVFIAKTSGLITSSSSVPLQHSFSTFRDDDQTTKRVKNGEEDEQQHGVVEKSVTSPMKDSGNVMVDKEVVMVEYDDSPFKRWFFDNVKMEKSVNGKRENEDIKELSMNEVNKRFDEFIRKMKEEIRLEASYQQLAMSDIA